MEPVINCPHCGQRYQPTPDLLDFEVKCSTCGKDFLFVRRPPQQPPQKKRKKTSGKKSSSKTVVFFLVLITLAAALITWAIMLPPENYDHIIIEIMVLNDAGEYEKAFKTAYEAANRDIPAAQYELAQMYHAGDGVRASFREYTKWMKKALNNGFFCLLVCDTKNKKDSERAKKVLKNGSLTERAQAAYFLQDEKARQEIAKEFPRLLTQKRGELWSLFEKNNNEKIKQLLAEDFRCIPLYVSLLRRKRLSPKERFSDQPPPMNREETEWINQYIEQAKNAPNPSRFYIQLANIYRNLIKNPELAEKYIKLAIGENNRHAGKTAMIDHLIFHKDIDSAMRAADELLAAGYWEIGFSILYDNNIPENIKQYYRQKVSENKKSFIQQLKQGK